MSAIIGKLDEVRLLRGLTDNSDVVFVDIGANMGVFTLTAAKHGYKVLAFEPMAQNEAAIRQSVCLNSDVDEEGRPRGFMDLIVLYKLGLSSKRKTCAVMSEDYNFSNGHAVCENETARTSWMSLIKRVRPTTLVCMPKVYLIACMWSSKHVPSCVNIQKFA